MYVQIANNTAFYVSLQDFEKAKQELAKTQKKKYYIMWQDALESLINNSPKPHWKCDQKTALLLMWYFMDQNKGFHYAQNAYSALISLYVFLEANNFQVSEFLIDCNGKSIWELRRELASR